MRSRDVDIACSGKCGFGADLDQTLHELGLESPLRVSWSGNATPAALVQELTTLRPQSRDQPARPARLSLVRRPRPAVQQTRSRRGCSSIQQGLRPQTHRDVCAHQSAANASNEDRLHWGDHPGNPCGQPKVHITATQEVCVPLTHLHEGPFGDIEVRSPRLAAAGCSRKLAKHPEASMLRVACRDMAGHVPIKLASPSGGSFRPLPRTATPSACAWRDARALVGSRRAADQRGLD